MRRSPQLVAALALVVASCGTGAAEEDRNLVIPIGLLGKQGVAVAAGRSHTCAITTKKTVECWGSNNAGQFGTADQFSAGEPAQSATPVEVKGLPANLTPVVLAQGAGASHVCVVYDNGDLWCWGSNGQFESGPRNNWGGVMRTAPHKMASGIVDAALGQGQTCILTAAGRVQCWGLNMFPNVGWERWSLLGWGDRFIGLQSVQYSDVRDIFLDIDGRVVDIEGGTHHFCALLDDQTVQCWGANMSGGVGQEPNQPGGAGLVIEVPTQVPSLMGVKDIAVGYLHSCAVDIENRVWCWGNAAARQLAGGYLQNSSMPVRVEFPPLLPGGQPQRPVVRSIFAGEDNTCVIDESGFAKCWGDTIAKLWGADVVEYPRYATLVRGTDDSLVGSLGTRHLCTISMFGLPRCNGQNSAGQTGTGEVSLFTMTHTAVKTYVAANLVVRLPDFTFPGVDLGFVGGGSAGGGLGGGVPQASPSVADQSQQQGAVVGSSSTIGGDQVPTTTSVTNETVSSVPSVVSPTMPRLKVKRTARVATLARWATLTVPKGAKVTFSIMRSSRRLCATSSGKLKGVRPGVCTVTVKVAKKGIRTKTKKVSIRIVR